MSAEARFASALCVVCQSADSGIVLPAHVIAQIRSGGLDVQYSDMNYDPILERNIDLEEDRIAAELNPGFFRVVRRKIFEAAKRFLDPPVNRPKTTPSKVVAQAKKRKRIFDGPID